MATHVSHANRFSHFAGLPTEKNTTNQTDGTNASTLCWRAENLSARARRRRRDRFSRFALRLRRARRRCSRSGLCAGGEFGAFLEPGLIILRCIDHQCAFHSVMAEATQLGANHFIASGLDRRKPNRMSEPGIASPAIRMSGIKKSWITSLEESSAITGRSTGT